MPDETVTWTTADRVRMQNSAPLTWMTVHRMRFDRPVDAKEGGIGGPVGAALTLIGPDSRLDGNGMRQSFSNTWGGAAFYEDCAAAEAAMDDDDS